MSITTNLVDLPVGSTFKVKDDDDIWTVVSEDTFNANSWLVLPDDVIPATYPSSFDGSASYDYVEPNEVEKVLSIGAASAAPQTTVTEALPNTRNEALVAVAAKFGDAVEFTYRKKNGEPRYRYVEDVVLDGDKFSGYDHTRNSEYRQFRFDRIEGGVTLT